MLNHKEIKTILKENNISILKKFGQNFLISQDILNKIIETADINPQDTIIEIGPGLGGLTFELAKKAKKIIAIEKDIKMAEILKKSLVKKNILNVEIINEDALHPTPLLGAEGWGEGEYKLVANLPYNIATAVIMKFLTTENPPKKIVVMVQKEVAQRIIASPPKTNKLAIFCQIYSTPKIIEIVPPTAFYPKPKIDSAILELIPHCRYQIPTILTNLINAGFSHPRKTLLNNLYEGRPNIASKERVIEWLEANNINPTQRPETLSIHNWIALAKTLKTFHNN